MPRVEQPQDPRAQGIGRLGTWLLIASLGMLFGAALVGYLVIRMRAPEWPPPGSPSLPGGVWISTAILIALSATLVLAERAIRAGRQDRLVGRLIASDLLALAFLASQLRCWVQLAADNVLPEQNLLIWGFFTLTFLHAVHVLAGLVPLVLVTLRARADRYTAAAHEGVHLVGMYWHFLLVTWVAILGVLSF
jgi:cytochrome c oxidase subunit 3